MGLWSTLVGSAVYIREGGSSMVATTLTFALILLTSSALVTPYSHDR